MLKKILISIITDQDEMFKFSRYSDDYAITIYECGYESRSGYHWHYCYDTDGNEINGHIPVIRTSINKICPLPLEELYKPIPMELKNIVGIDTLKEANEELVKHIADYLKKLYGEYAKNFIIITDYNGIKIALRADRVAIKKVYIFRAEKIAEQGNLSIYIVHDYHLGFETDTWLNCIYNHHFEPIDAGVVIADTHTVYTTAILAKIKKPVTIISEDHPEKIVLTPAVYLFTHPIPRNKD